MHLTERVDITVPTTHRVSFSAVTLGSPHGTYKGSTGQRETQRVDITVPTTHRVSFSAVTLGSPHGTYKGSTGQRETQLFWLSMIFRGKHMSSKLRLFTKRFSPVRTSPNS